MKSSALDLSNSRNDVIPIRTQDLVTQNNIAQIDQDSSEKSQSNFASIHPDADEGLVGDTIKLEPTKMVMKDKSSQKQKDPRRNIVTQSKDDL